MIETTKPETTKPDKHGNNTSALVATSLLRVFAHPDTGSHGNPCQVTVSAQAQETPPDEHSPYTQCCIWPLEATVEGEAEGEEGEAEVAMRCWTASGQRIACCGHGALAGAALWLRQSGRSRVSLQMNGSVLQCHDEDAIYWLSFNRIQTSSCAVPQWLNKFFPQLPQYAAVAGGEQGYLILEWPTDHPLPLLMAPGNELKSHSARALIVTAACSVGNRRCGEDIRYRYFAPQYGTPEDPATGSAMRILADYWQQRLGLGELTAYQCSAEGGILYSRISADRVEIGGRVET